MSSNSAPAFRGAAEADAAGGALAELLVLTLGAGALLGIGVALAIGGPEEDPLLGSSQPARPVRQTTKARRTLGRIREPLPCNGPT
jgi:hypothetical protein